MLSWFLNMRIRTKVFASFSLVTLILLVVILIIIQMVKDIESTTKRVIGLRSPTAQASLMMLNGMNHSLASLRGWIILGEEEFKVERHSAWANQIEPSLEEMKSLSSQWSSQDNLDRLQKILQDIEKFKKYQQEIEDIAQTEENTPARKILFQQVDPLEKEIIRNITRMIKLEFKNQQTVNRRGLASLLNDLEISTSNVIEDIEEYLLSGSDEFKRHFEKQWAKNNHQYVELRSRSSLLSKDQRNALERLVKARDKMGPLMQRMISIRSGDDWNKANFKLKTQAGPLAANINHILNEMVSSQNTLLETDLAEVSRQTHFLVVILVGWFILGGLLSGVLGATITRGISTPLNELERVITGLVRGNFKQAPIETITKDELGMLVRHTNELSEKLRAFKKHAAGLSVGNVKAQEFDLDGDFKSILEEIRKLALKDQQPPPADN